MSDNEKKLTAEELEVAKHAVDAAIFLSKRELRGLRKYEGEEGFEAAKSKLESHLESFTELQSKLNS